MRGLINDSQFIEEGAKDKPENLLTADQLKAGKTYSMVVSDPYGLRRYQTGDLFLCRGFVAGLPNLSFKRHRDLEILFYRGEAYIRACDDGVPEVVRGIFSTGG